MRLFKFICERISDSSYFKKKELEERFKSYNEKSTATEKKNAAFGNSMKTMYDNLESLRKAEDRFYLCLKVTQDKCKEERFLDELTELCEVTYRDFKNGYREYK